MAQLTPAARPADLISFIRNHPALTAALLAALLLLVLALGVCLILQRRRLSARADACWDELTGVRNKNAYRELEKELQRAVDEKAPPPFAIVVCDLNGLKATNDAQGHQAGDRLLQEACRLICRVFAHSPVFRIGGDEFAAVLRGQDYENREALTEELRAAVLASRAAGGVTVAVGMAEHAGEQSAAAVFAEADRRMYADKKRLKGV